MININKEGFIMREAHILNDSVVITDQLNGGKKNRRARNHGGYCNSLNGMHGILYKKNPITGEMLVVKHNSVIAPGATYTACKQWNIKPDVKFLSYNQALSLENTITSDPENDEFICLFAVGTDGCSDDDTQIYDVDYTKWIQPESLVPFIYSDADVTPEQRKKYFGRKVDGSKYIYYFKTFDSEPVLHRVLADGTPVDIATIYSTKFTSPMSTFVEVEFKIDLDECRDKFIADNKLSEARVNTISLLTAWKSTKDGNIYYQDIQPMTKLNIKNDDLDDLDKGIIFVYRLFY